MGQKMQSAPGGNLAFLTAAGATGERSVVIAFQARQHGKSAAMAQFAHRNDLADRLRAASDRCLLNPAWRDMWREKATKAIYLPTSQLTAQPARVPVDFSPDGYGPRKRSIAWVIWLLVLVAAAIAVTPPLA